MSITLERIFSLIKESGKSEYAIKKETGLKNSTFSEWRAGRANPSTEAIITLSRYFNVSADYLLGLSDDCRHIEMEKSKNIKQAVNKPLDTTPHIVAHIDILGTKTMVANKKTNDKLLKTMLATIEDWKKHIKDCNNLQFTVEKLSIKIFSDNIVLYIPFDKNRYNELLQAISQCAIYIQRSLLLNKDLPLPVRGGISIENFYADDDFVYGQALVDSYEIEENLAIVPRIVVSNNIIQTLFNKNELSKFVGYGNLFIDDFDGFYHLNFLYKQSEKEVLQIQDFIRKIMFELETKHNEQVIQKIKSGKNEIKDYTRLYQKYGWLLKYTCRYYDWLMKFQLPIFIKNVEEELQQKRTLAELSNNKEEDIATIENIKALLAENDGLDFIERLYKELQEKQKIFVLTWLVGYMVSQGLPINKFLGK